jgi:ABC-type spermidine/putrescine transport system permease subunit II
MFLMMLSEANVPKPPKISLSSRYWKKILCWKRNDTGPRWWRMPQVTVTVAVTVTVIVTVIVTVAVAVARNAQKGFHLLWLFCAFVENSPPPA